MSGISTHVLDLARGRPADGVAVRLESSTGSGWRELTRTATDADGRVGALLPAGTALLPGRFRLTFELAAYFARHGVEGFFPEATLVFDVRDANQKHHVPLLVSPFGYSTYRGKLMAIHLAESRYGKSTVRLVTVDRGAAGGHALHDLTVDISFRGDYDAAHVAGDNARVYATDSMKNSVYILARRHGVTTPEEFAERLAAHYLSRDPGPERVRIEISARPWRRIEVDGAPHPHAFAEAGSERRAVRLDRARDGASTLCSGVDDLLVLKTTDSGFAGFPRDECTTLPETDDRIFATAIEARWRYAARPADFDAAFDVARRHLLEAFAAHRSASVQHTLYAMGERVIEAMPEIDEVRLRLPNRHHLPANLVPFGLDNPNLVFVATSEPFGDIRGVVRRST